MNSSHYVDANHVTQSCNLTHLICGGGTPYPPLPNVVIINIHPQSTAPTLQTNYLLPGSI